MSDAHLTSLPHSVLANEHALASTEQDCLFTCALRYDLSSYEDVGGNNSPTAWDILIEQDVMPETDDARMMLFFRLQRGLGKWGLERARPEAYRIVLQQIE